MSKYFQVGVKGLVKTSQGILLLKKESPQATFFDLPGGRIEAAETVHTTLQRELVEELPAIDTFTVGSVVGAYRVDIDIEKDCGLFLVIYEVTAKDFEVRLSSEHSDYCWVSKENMQSVLGTDIAIHPELKKILLSQTT